MGGEYADTAPHALGACPIHHPKPPPALAVPPIDSGDLLKLGLAAHKLSSYAIKKRSAKRLRDRYSDLPEFRFQYHRTYDTAVSKSAIWVAHTEVFQLKRNRIVGTSENHHSTKFTYATSGTLQQSQALQFQYRNRRTEEPLVQIKIDRDRPPDLMIGTWDGEDFDGRLTTGPIIYSKRELPKKKYLNQLVRKYARNVICTCKPKMA